MEVNEAADLLDNLIGMIEDSGGRDYDTALRMAINALSAQPDVPDINVGDTVSRQAVIDAIVTWTVEDRPDVEMPTDLIDRIRNLASAQPDLDEWCYDCSEYDSERHCCPRWNRVIRDALKDMKDAQPEIILCKDCKHYDGRPCGIVDWYNTADDFCSKGERRTDETD